VTDTDTDTDAVLEQDIARQLVSKARAEGMKLIGPGGSMNALARKYPGATAQLNVAVLNAERTDDFSGHARTGRVADAGAVVGVRPSRPEPVRR
jgi:hypothetical protein